MGQTKTPPNQTTASEGQGTTPQEDTSATDVESSDSLDRNAVRALVHGVHGAPFDLLGPHRHERDGHISWIIRAFLPRVSEATLVVTPSGAPEQRFPMREEHPAGLYVAEVDSPDRPDYQFEVVRPSGTVERLYDPYAFPPQLSDFDLYLIGEGTHQHLYERLGAHPRTVNGVTGVNFAVWAPNARRVSVVGDFNGWDDHVNPMRLRSPGVWELFVPGLHSGALYKYAVLSWNNGYRVLKSDPMAFWAELRPGTASRVYDLGGYEWHDAHWLSERTETNALNSPISVYEVHVGSWRPPTGGESGLISYRDLAHQLVPYVKGLGYTHIELMPVAEHPFDGSWGYQVTGYFAPTSRYGTPHDFMYFVDYCHQHGIGVLMDWVPAHFPRDEHGLAYFDGSHLYEHQDPRQGAHQDWGTLIFNYGRNEVRNFLIANALFWFEQYHIDGLRVDAVASMLYLDYSRHEGEWVPNRYGGRENLEAIDFLRMCNRTIFERFPDVLMIAEESTAYTGVTHPISQGGLGFSFKWNMGWMHDMLEYMKLDPVYRKFYQNTLTFSFVYAWSERFMLPFSHDEVVHMKGSMINKMPGDHWQKFANLRTLYAYMYGHPGKKLLFMGGEIAQWAEWNAYAYLDWALVEGPYVTTTLHDQLRTLVRDLNGLMRSHPALYRGDNTPEGFGWIDGSDTENSVLAFTRCDPEGDDTLLFVCNFTPVPRQDYRVGVPHAGSWREVLNTDSDVYGGSNVGNGGQVNSEAIPMHGQQQSVLLTLPPLATVIFHAPKSENSGQ